MKHRRDATRLIHDILALASSGTPKTGIIYGANLNFRLADSYIEFLISKEYLTKPSHNDQAGRGYELTEAGKHLLLLLQKVETELNDLFFPTPKPIYGLNIAKLKPFERIKEEEYPKPVTNQREEKPLIISA